MSVADNMRCSSFGQTFATSHCLSIFLESIIFKIGGKLYRGFVMRHRFAQFVALVLALVPLSPLSAAETVKHTVASGESISFICITLYGHYESAMNAEILKLNPKLADVNQVSKGSELVFPAPSGAGSPSNQFEKGAAVRQAVTTYVEGDVTVTGSGGRVVKLAPNTILNPGDAIKTAPGARAEIIVDGESVVRVKENTKLTFRQAHDQAAANVPTKFSLDFGSAWTAVKRMAATVNRFELTLPTAVAGVHGTVYQATVGDDSSSVVKVYDGAVNVHAVPPPDETAGPTEVEGPHEVSASEWTRIVRTMQQVKIPRSGKPGNPEAFKKSESDSWEKWNSERDQSAFEIFGETR